MRRKKVGIVTIVSENLGNRLQNYALQEFLELSGVSVRTIPVHNSNFFIRKVKIQAKSILSFFLPKYRSVVWQLFDKKIHWENRTVSDASEILADSYDYFIAGSDQIWNPLFDFNSEREFLTFAPLYKRIAYAASIGIDKLPESVLETYKVHLQSFSAISVREESAAEIIYQLIHQIVPVVLDPTMLIAKGKWMDVAKNSRIKIKKKYVIKYFLGIRVDKYDSYIDRIAKENECVIIDITKYNNKYNNSIGPAEFVSLIANSFAVFTDSFHGTVFSILFERPFLVFDRPIQEGYGNMECRIDTLLKKFNLMQYRITENCILQQEYPKIDFIPIEKLLNKERKQATDYIKSALNL